MIQNGLFGQVVYKWGDLAKTAKSKNIYTSCMSLDWGG